MSVLLQKNETEIKTFDSSHFSINIHYNSTEDIASIFCRTSSYLVKYLNYSYFGGVVGASEITFKKAKIISELFFILRATTDTGDLVLEKAFLESKENLEIRALLEKGFKNIIAWLYVSSGEHTGPINNYVKTIEAQCKYIIQVASDIKDSSMIQNVVQIYKMLISNIENLVKQQRIPLALAFSKAKSIHQILESVSEYLLVSEDIIHDFAFNQKGLDYFFEQLLSEKDETVELSKRKEDEEEFIDTSPKESKEETKENKNDDILCNIESEIDILNDEPLSKIPQKSKEVKGKQAELEMDVLNDELFSYVSEKLKEEMRGNQVESEGKQEDHISIKGQMGRNVNNGDFMPNEFARTMTLVDSNIEKAKELTTNIDWSVNKKGYRQRLVYKKFEPGLNNEIWMLFKLNRVIEIKEIQIGFTNFWTVDSEVYIEPSSVIVETGLTENDTNAI